jgi:hypothetical protein
VACLKEAVTARTWSKGCATSQGDFDREPRIGLIDISQSRGAAGRLCHASEADSLVSESVPYSEVGWRLGTSKPTIICWKERFLREGPNGLDTSHPGPKPLDSHAGMPQESRIHLDV